MSGRRRGYFGIIGTADHVDDAALGPVLLMLPYYVTISAVYGGLTWADSILPAMVLHVVGDAVVLTRWWLTGTPESQIGPAASMLVQQSGVDGAFVATGIAAVALVVATAAAFWTVRARRLRESARSSRT